MVAAAGLVAAAVAFLAFGLYQLFLADLLQEASEQSSGLRGLGMMSVKRLGRMNQRLMWPGYETRIRRQLIKAGEPSQLQPEEILATQELAFLGCLVLGLIF